MTDCLSGIVKHPRDLTLEQILAPILGRMKRAITKIEPTAWDVEEQFIKRQKYLKAKEREQRTEA